MRPVTLGQLKGGITRLRNKGGASPAMLYDLKNGYVDIDGTARSRPGTSISYSLPAGTMGLVWFDGKFHVFAASQISSGSPDVVVEVLLFPDVEAVTPVLNKIHFAKPFLGALYVVAEWLSNGTIYYYHYWLQRGKVWQADHTYLPHAKPEELPVEPSTPNGSYYVPKPDTIPDPWAAAVARLVNDEISATANFIANNPNAADVGFKVIGTLGAIPISGTQEPEWNINIGGLTYEYYDAQDPTGGETSGGGTNGSGTGGSGTGGSETAVRPPANRPPYTRPSWKTSF